MSTTTTPSAFAKFCGPRALHAILAPRVDAECAASCILGVQNVRGLVTAPYTTEEDLAIVLSSFGFLAEPWDSLAMAPPGKTAERFLERALRAQPYRLLSPEDAREVIARFELPPARANVWARHADKLSLRRWLAMPGTWLFAVHNDHEGHWLAARDGRVIAGDSDGAPIWGSLPVITALRIRRRSAAS